MRCPVCGELIPGSASHCNCGYSFRAGRAGALVILPVGELPGVRWFFTRSWRTFGANWRTFLILAAIPTVILPCAAALIFGNYPSRPHGIFPVWTAHAAFTAIAAIVMIVNTTALITAAHRTSEGEAPTVGESYALSLGLVPQFLWTGILYVVVVIAGLALLMVPGIVMAIRYFAAPYLVILERTSGRRALSRSRELSQGRKLRIWWRELGCGILFSLTLSLGAAGITIAVGVALGNPLAGFAEPNPLWAETIELYGNIVSEALFVIFNVLLIKCLRALLAGSEASSPRLTARPVKEGS